MLNIYNYLIIGILKPSLMVENTCICATYVYLVKLLNIRPSLVSNIDIFFEYVTDRRNMMSILRRQGKKCNVIKNTYL